MKQRKNDSHVGTGAQSRTAAAFGTKRAAPRDGARDSLRWRVLLLSTVAAGALCVAAPRSAEAGPGPCVVGPLNVVHCTGNHANGIDAGVDFDPATIDTLEVDTLDRDIAPVGADGVRWINTPATSITIISTTGTFAIRSDQHGFNIQSGIGAAISLNHTGNIQAGLDGISAVSNANNGDSGAVSVDMLGNIVSGPNIVSSSTGISAASRVTGNGNAGGVTVLHTGNITANGLGILAESNVNGNGNSGGVTVESNGAIDDGITALSGVSGNGNSGAVDVSHQGSVSSGRISASSTVGGTGNAGAVTVSNTGNISDPGSNLSINASSRALTNGDSGQVTVTSTGNLIGGIDAESSASGNGNSGTVDVFHQGLLSGGIFATSTVGGTGNSGAVNITNIGDISGVIEARSTVDGTGDAAFVGVTNTGNIINGGSDRTISAISRALTDGNSGSVTISSVGNLIGGFGIEALSQANGAGSSGSVFIDSAGNISGVLGIVATARADGTGNAGQVFVTSTGSVTATDSTAVAAVSIASGGGNSGAVKVNSAGNIIAAAGTGIFASSESALGSAADVIITIDGNITAADHGIAAASIGTLGSGNVEVTINSGTVRGGSGGFGVQIFTDANSTLTIGSNASVLSLSGTAISSTGLGDDIVNNSGTVTGNVLLGAGSNLFENNGGLFNAGAIVDLGALGALDNSGTLAPGGNGTTLTSALTGDLILRTGGTFAVDVRAAGADRINASGSATLGGRVLPIVLGLTSGTQQFTILSAAGGLANTGDITVTDTAVFDFELLFQGNDMILSVTADFTPANANLTPNQQAVGNHLQAAVAAGGGSLGTLTGFIGSIVDPAALAAALDRLHPEPYLAQVKSLIFGSLGFTDAMQSCPVSQGPNVAATLVEGQCAWARMGGRVLEVDRTRENIGFTDKSWGGSAGVQFALAPNWLGSVALGYDRSDIKVDDRATASGDIFQIGAGAKYTTGAWQFSGTVTGGLAQYDTTRFAVMPGVNASGEASMNFVAGRLRAAHVFGTDASYVKPLVDLDAIVIRRDGILETGAGPAGLNVKGQTDAFFSIAPAIEFGSQFSYTSGSLLRPFLRLGVRLFSDDELDASATFIGTPAGVPAFTATTPLGQWMGEVSAGLEILSSDRYDARLSYEGRFAERTTQHGGNIKLRARF